MEASCSDRLSKSTFSQHLQPDACEEDIPLLVGDALPTAPNHTEPCKAAVKMSPYTRPKHQRVHCTQCNENPDGFRGHHELQRHMSAKHEETAHSPGVPDSPYSVQRSANPLKTSLCQDYAEVGTNCKLDQLIEAAEDHHRRYLASLVQLRDGIWKSRPPECLGGGFRACNPPHLKALSEGVAVKPGDAPQPNQASATLENSLDIHGEPNFISHHGIYELDSQPLTPKQSTQEHCSIASTSESLLSLPQLDTLTSSPVSFEDGEDVNEPPFYDFGDNSVAPSSQMELFKSGGSGTVYRYQVIVQGSIPNCEPREKKPHCVAIKKLASRDQKILSREAEILKQLNKKPHPHLVSLLGTYRMGGQYHLIFPWADGDLAMFWRLNPKPEVAKSNLAWAAEQMLGLASALSYIHGFTEEQKNREWYGRHGDIKPENILVFSEFGNTNHTLRITDFGTTCLHSPGSTFDLPHEDTKYTPVYRAPEFDLQPQKMTSSYDVWGLGCVFFELVTWIIFGNEGLEKLVDIRSDPADSPNCDAFFALQMDADGEQTANIKLELENWLFSIRQHPRSTPFTEDVLDLILNQMLVVEGKDSSKKRSSSQEICKALSKMCGMFEQNSTYSSQRGGCDGIASFDTVDTTLLEMVYSNQSGSRKRRLDRTVDATYYAEGSTKRGRNSESQDVKKARRKWACPFYKIGVVSNEHSRACQGPGWLELHRLKEHLLRSHTPEKYKSERVCGRCDEGFETEEHFTKHQLQEPPCLIRAPEIVYGKFTREQAANMRSTKRKPSGVTDEDRWYEWLRNIWPSYDPSIHVISPYYEETTMSSLNTISTQSSNTTSQYKDYLRCPLPEDEEKELAADLGDALGISSPEKRKLLAAKFREFQLKHFQKFDENKLKSTYSIPPGGGDDEAKADISGNLEVPDLDDPVNRLLFSMEGDMNQGDLWPFLDNF